MMLVGLVVWCRLDRGGVVGRVLVAVDAGVGVSASEFAAGWGADPLASADGPAVVEAAPGGVFLPGLVELVALPAAVNLATAALYDLIKRVVAAARRSSPGSSRTVEELQVEDFTAANGDRLVVVRWRREQS